jgi:saccharopine dehydrogenase-like NADP-dependent oxidoreductase
MKQILVLGAGRSSWYLLDYLSAKSAEKKWRVTVCDRDASSLSTHCAGFDVDARQLDVNDESALGHAMASADLVVSLLPPAMHISVAALCLKHRKHLATASYVSPEMRAMHNEAKENGLVFLNEMGLDPGIDHLSAMQAMDKLRTEGATISSFESYCGGLVHKEDCGDNPWKYKFSWNPRNVVLAGQGGHSIYRENANLRCIPWHQLFAKSQPLNIPGMGVFDSYANRDSLTYEKIYGLEAALTIKRGTLRRENFCKHWHVFVALGFTDAQTVLPPAINNFSKLADVLTGKQNISLGAWLVQNGMIDAAHKSWFDFFEDMSEVKLPEGAYTAADILQFMLMEKWKLASHDRDEVVMYHRIGYTLNQEQSILHSTMKLAGKDPVRTAMSATVGLPLAMGVELILTGAVSETGVVIPVTKEWYEPVLEKLVGQRIVFSETTETN